ncbi:prolyl oligopeptidase family protein [Pseudomonas sp. SJZ079]|uniref:alpha/beta hydrolase family protein n=1 Tax=Pseudomonas sp. SJZ079 TaxID=2572887 RepID=UPI00119A85D6|nr:alpha/beta fold hydrolase [Pseudomonas sp. SJZ079]TWC35679.1 prolyl oligopeptidase family protein [Pseudomonas sp. SJZ079]
MKNAAYRLFKKPFFGRFARPWRWPDSVDKHHWQRLSVESQSGAIIAALLAPAHTPRAKGAVLMSHPMGVVAKGFWMKYGHAELLRQAGYHVMVFDLNGFGESTSTTMDYPLDVLAAGQALQARYPDLPVAVVGASMGAAMSVCAMAQPEHPFKAAVLEAAFPTLLHFWSRYPIPKLGIQLSKVVYPAGERSLRPTHAAENLVGSPALLMIYGDADEFTPVKDGELLWQALRHRTQTEFWQVPGAKHTHAYAAQPKEYAEKVIGFLDRQLVASKLAS